MSEFKLAYIFSTIVLKMSQILNVYKIRPVGDELFGTDGWTDSYKQPKSQFSEIREEPNIAHFFTYL